MPQATVSPPIVASNCTLNSCATGCPELDEELELDELELDDELDDELDELELDELEDEELDELELELDEAPLVRLDVLLFLLPQPLKTKSDAQKAIKTLFFALNERRV